MNNKLILAFLTSTLVACSTGSIDADDQTIPNLSLEFFGDVDAIYSDGSIVEGPIDSLLRPTVQTEPGDTSYSVIARATDDESGIEFVSASLRLTGFCTFNFISTPVTEAIDLRFSSSNSPGVNDEGEAFLSTIAIIEISPTDIWQRSRCEQYSESNGRVSGTLTSLEVRYNILGKNNVGLENVQIGGFDIENIDIDFPAPS